MSSWVWIVVVVIVVVALLVTVARRSATVGADPTEVTLTPELADRVRTLATAGRKIEAIKELRTGTGMSLVAAKAVVERMAASGPA